MIQVTTIPKGAMEDTRPEDIKTAVYRTTDIIPLESLETFLNELGKISIRAKGFVRVAVNEYRLFHLTFGTYEIIPLKDFTGNCEIIAFGAQMNQRLLRATFRNVKELAS